MRLLAFAIASLHSFSVLTVKLSLLFWVIPETTDALPYQSSYQRIAEAWTWPVTLTLMAFPWVIMALLYLIFTRKRSESQA